MGEAGTNNRTMGVREFAQRMKQAAETHPRSMTLFVGAGCSRSSGIPTAGELVRDRWLPKLYKLKCDDNRSQDEWLEEFIPEYNRAAPAKHYGKVIAELFLEPIKRQHEIEQLCDGCEPSIGYAILAQLLGLENSPFGHVVTTNFDELIADAMFLYSEARPLVIPHESLAEFMRAPKERRPLVFKIHGDAKLSPRNTEEETRELPQNVRDGLAHALRESGLVFMGYAGADESIQRFLKGLAPGSLPHGVFWVNDAEPSHEEMRAWLGARNASRVTHLDFDEIMVVLAEAFGLSEPSMDRFERMKAEYAKRLTEVQKRLNDRFDEPRDDDDEAVRGAVAKLSEGVSDAWGVFLKASGLERSDPDAAERVYEEGIAAHPGFAPLLGNYALFLKNVRGDYDRAELFYERAIEADPRHAHILGNYASFLKNVRGDHDRAELFYERAIEADPRHANNLGNYASFLRVVGGDHDRAESFYERAIEADPRHANNLGNYASFLTYVRGDHDRAESFYERAIEADPRHANNLGNYAAFLKDVRGDYDRAESFYERAIEADPSHANSLGNYAAFLTDVRGDYDRAESFYERAIEVDPSHANNRGNYASFLWIVRGDHDRAESFYERAIEIDPRRATTFGNYAKLLLGRGDRERGWAMLRRAMEELDESRLPPLAVELAFYRLCHGDTAEQHEALRDLRRLIEDGARSTPWNFDLNIERAKLDGHQEAEWLPTLAAVINDAEPVSALDGWEAWRGSGPS